MAVDLKNISWLTGLPKIDTKVPAIQKVNQNPELEQGIAAQNREMPPKFLDTTTSGSYFTHGTGNFKFNMNHLA